MLSWNEEALEPGGVATRLTTEINRLSARERERLAPVLARAGLLKGLDAKASGDLLDRSTLALLRSGGTLWRESDPAHDIGVVISGRLKLVRQARTETILDVAAPGDVLGEDALAAGSAYQSTVVGLRRSEILLVPIPAVQSLLAGRSESAGALAADLAAQLIRLYRVAEDLGLGGVEQRLARVFVRLAERMGEPFLGGIYIGLKLRRRDLAGMSSTTLESVSRHISAWQKAKLVTPQPAGYLVHDLEELKRRAEPKD